MIKKILAVLAAVASFFSAIFYVLMKQAKTEKKLAEAEQRAQDAERREEQTEVVREAEKAVAETVVKLEKEDEELVKRAGAGNDLSSFNAGIDLLRKQSERGNKRNSSAGSSGA